MTHYIITKIDNKTLIECETVIKDTYPDLSASVNIKLFSYYLIGILESIKNSSIEYSMFEDKFINDVYELSEIRGLWWEKAINNYNNIDDFVKDLFNEFVKNWDYFKYVTD
jgi:hypothetical protein